MRKLLLIVFLAICKVSAFASHIVGGEFELIHLSGNNYRLNLIIYFDEIHGHPGAKYEPTPVAWIFRKSDNQAMRQVSLPFASEQLVKYTVPECANDEIVKTTKLIFSRVITLTPDEYDHAEGYYIVWQRCCRNYDIANIVSQNPDIGGIGSGQTFYLEIPPLIKEGERFINSSPQLFPPLSDYGCVNRDFYADFKGYDADGDSLVYTLVTPLNTPSAVPHPQPPSTAPYPRVLWESGYSISNIAQGNPDMTISAEGLLRVTPTLPGIFVFAVKCEEYRHGTKIGEVRRDFQMVVVDCPPPGNAPNVQVELADGSIYKEGEVLRFAAGEEKCVRFIVADESGGAVNLKLDPEGYDQENFTMTILSRSAARDRLEAEVCFTDCPPTKNLPFDVNFIGQDNTCPLPMEDTVRVKVAITPPANDLPVVKHKEDDDSGYETTKARSVTVTEEAGGLKIIKFLGEDANSDYLDFMVESVGFDMNDFGMKILEKSNMAGQREIWLQWNYDCQQVSFDDRSNFQVKVYLEDQDICLYEDPVLLDVNLNVVLPDNSAPVIYSNNFQTGPDNYFRYESQLQKLISFDVNGRDADGDYAEIKAVPANFTFSSYGIDYSGVSGEGRASSPQIPTQLNSTFKWPLTCSMFNLVKQDSFRIYFIIEDYDKCELTNADTMTVDFIFSEPDNTVPQLNLTILNGLTLVNDTVQMNIGQKLDLRVTGTDAEGDNLFLSLLDSEQDGLNYQFKDAEGQGTVTSIFSWSPECVHLAGKSNEYFAFTFNLQDSHCKLPRFSRQTFYIQVLDLPAGDEHFLPPNVFTPNNGDLLNDYFGMYRIDPDTKQEVNILPQDNCQGYFKQVIIYNRWGKEVFSSFSKNFKWYADGMSSGVYFYSVEYSNRTYRGTVTLKN